MKGRKGGGRKKRQNGGIDRESEDRANYSENEGWRRDVDG